MCIPLGFRWAPTWICHFFCPFVCLSICGTSYLRNHTSSAHNFCYTCVKWCLQVFFSFFKILIFWVVSGVKGEKMAQNDKKLSLPHFISQEAYIMWSWFLVHMCKMMTSPDAFFIFSKVWFSGLFGGVKGQNMTQNDKKNCPSLYISRTIPHMTGSWYTCVE